MKEKRKEETKEETNEERKEKKYGKPIQHDPAFNGPIHNDRRSCTDIICLFGFIVFLGAWLGVGIYGMKEGSIVKLLAPKDSNGGRCGVDTQLENKKYLVFFDIAKCLSSSTQIVKKCSTPQVCVNKCPEKTFVFKSPQMNETTFHQFKSSMVCTYDVDVQTLSYNQAVENIRKEKCATYVVKSDSVLGRCFVNMTEAIKVKEITKYGQNMTQMTDKITDMTKMSSVAQIVQELVEARWYMLGALVASVLVCFIYILLMRWLVAPLVWTSIVALFGALGFVLYLSYKKYKHYKNNPTSSTTLTAYKDPNFWLALLITAAIVTIILFLMIVFLRSRIVLAIAMISEGSKAVFAIKSTIFFPIFPWTLQCSVIAYGVVVIMLLVSIDNSTFRVESNYDTDCKCSKYADNDPCDPKVFASACHNSKGDACQNTTCTFVESINLSIIPYLHFVNALAFFWTTFFISGLGDLMLANSFSTWYWTFKKRNLPFFTLSSSIFTALRFHMGTVAFGALIIAIIRLIRFLASLLKNKTQYKNPVASTIFCVLNCCLRMLENLFKFISKNAYIMCAIHGTNFCSSTRKAFSLLMRNIIRVYVLDKMIDFIFFISKVIISVGAGFGIYYLLELTNGDRLDFIFVPAIIIAVFTYLICTIFFNVYAIAVDTLFLCFLEDCERNDGSVEKPYFMSKNLMKILGKKNKNVNDKKE